MKFYHFMDLLVNSVLFLLYMNASASGNVKHFDVLAVSLFLFLKTFIVPISF